MIACSCPGCGQNYRLADETAGRTVRCRECQGAFTVPERSIDRSGPLETDRPSPSPTQPGKDLAVRCGQCGTEYLLDRSFAGRTFRCRACSGTIQAPEIEGPNDEDRAVEPRIVLGARRGRGRSESGPKRQKSSRMPGFLLASGLLIGSILVLSGLIWLTLVAAKQLRNDDAQAGQEVHEPPAAIAQQPWSIAEPRRKSFGSMIDRAKKNAESLTAFGDGSVPRSAPGKESVPSTTVSNAPQVGAGLSNARDSQAPAVAADEMPEPKEDDTRPANSDKKAARKRVITPLGEHHRASKSLVDTVAEINGILSILKQPEDLEKYESRLKAVTDNFEEIVTRFGKLPELKPEERAEIAADYGEAVQLVITRLGEERKRIRELTGIENAIGAELDEITDSISKLKVRHY